MLIGDDGGEHRLDIGLKVPGFILFQAMDSPIVKHLLNCWLVS